ncbi:MAG: DUF362 domain-containing protein [Dehalococcoidales bacterium]|jgi:uncharacterized protein (DUF362 family)/Pyruvate/2-oxoacid:ferredoxin oxidoreductase delta subunit
MNGKSRVALVACDTYDEEKVYRAVARGVGLIGGIEQFVTAGEKIVLKPNVLIGSAPEKCVCTHPAVFKAAAKIFLESGAVLSCGDSPGFGGTAAGMRTAGLKQVADELNITVADFSKGTSVSHREGRLVKRFTIADAVLAADGLVSLSKLKTHGLMRMTGAIKNQFGCIPGLIKGQHHARMADPFEFAAMLADLNTLLKPRLYIMDAVMAMEGNGPRNGSPRKIGAILVSKDPVALDAVACKIINLDPAFVPTLASGEKTGLGTYHEENIEVAGEKAADFICPDFDVVRKPVEHAVSGRFRIFFKNRMSPRPLIDKDKCTECGTCIRHCPVTPKAVDWVGGDEKRPPVHNYDRCIRCFCCQELCPEGAILIKESWLGRLLNR